MWHANLKSSGVTLKHIHRFANLTFVFVDTRPDTLFWRWFLGLSALPAAIVGVAYRLLPESPRFLSVAGRHDEAQKVKSPKALRTFHSQILPKQKRQFSSVLSRKCSIAFWQCWSGERERKPPRQASPFNCKSYLAYLQGVAAVTFGVRSRGLWPRHRILTYIPCRSGCYGIGHVAALRREEHAVACLPPIV